MEVVGVVFAPGSQREARMSNSDGVPCAANEAANYEVPGPATHLADFPGERGLTGLDLCALSPGTEVVMETQTSRYRFVMLDAGSQHALVQGGRYIPHETEAEVVGSILDGPVLKKGWISLGAFVAISLSNKHIFTSRVRSILVNAPEFAPVDAQEEFA